ncbi:retrovirus-related pol polyprotein from transposon TNT 1-94 [Tanacetum coccineum]
MSNTNTNLQTQTSSALHNAIMEAGGKDRPPMLAPSNYTVPVTESSSETTTKGYMENYKNVSQDIRNQLDAKAEAVQIILTGIDNDIYSTVDACPNACEMWNVIERLKQGESINVQDLETNLYWEFEKFTSRDGESLESYYSSRANLDNTPRINRGTGYDNQRVVNVVEARENVGTQVVQQCGIQCYNCKKYGHVARECQKPKRAKDVTYHKEKMLLCKQEEAGIQLSAEEADWRDDTDDEPKDQELEARYKYMAQIQEVTSDDADNSGPIFDTEQLQKEHGDTNITTDSLDMSNNKGEADQEEDEDLARERDLLASLIDKLKCEIDDSKNRNKLLESSNNHFKEANNKLSKTNQLMFKDLKKFQAELDRYHDVNYASKVETDCAKAKGDLVSYKMEF